MGRPWLVEDGIQDRKGEVQGVPWDREVVIESLKALKRVREAMQAVIEKIKNMPMGGGLPNVLVY